MILSLPLNLSSAVCYISVESFQSFSPWGSHTTWPRIPFLLIQYHPLWVFDFLSPSFLPLLCSFFPVFCCLYLLFLSLDAPSSWSRIPFLSPWLPIQAHPHQKLLLFHYHFHRPQSLSLCQKLLCDRHTDVILLLWVQCEKLECANGLHNHLLNLVLFR